MICSEIKFLDFGLIPMDNSIERRIWHIYGLENMANDTSAAYLFD